MHRVYKSVFNVFKLVHLTVCLQPRTRRKTTEPVAADWWKCSLACWPPPRWSYSAYAPSCWPWAAARNTRPSARRYSKNRLVWPSTWKTYSWTSRRTTTTRPAASTTTTTETPVLVTNVTSPRTRCRYASRCAARVSRPTATTNRNTSSTRRPCWPAKTTRPSAVAKVGTLYHPKITIPVRVVI